MILPEWKNLANISGEVLPLVPEHLEVARAEIDGQGLVRAINPSGTHCWGWQPGDLVPGDLLIALKGISTGLSQILPVTQGGVVVRGVHLDWKGTWMLIGYPHTQRAHETPPVEFKSLIEKIPALVVRMQMDAVLRYANAEGFQLLGYTAVELLRQPSFMEVVHPEERWKLLEGIRATLEHGRALVNLRLLTRNQRVRLVEMHLFLAVPPHDGDIEAVVFDVTEQSETEEALLRSDLLYRTFIEQSPIGMLHLDETGLVTFENHPFRQIVGENPEDAWIGLNIFEIPGLDPYFQVLVRNLLERGEAFHGEEIVYQKHTAPQPWQLVLHGSPILHPEGQIMGAVLMIEDVTQERQRDAELELHQRYSRAEASLREMALSNPDETRFLYQAAQLLGETAGADRVHLLLLSAVASGCVTRAAWAAQGPRPVVLNVQHLLFPSLRRMDQRRDGLHLERRDATDEGILLLDLTGAEAAVWAPFYENAQFGGYVLVERMQRTARSWEAVEQGLMVGLVRVFETLWSWLVMSNRYRLTVSTIDDGLFNFTFDAEHARYYLFATPQTAHLTGYTPAQLLARGQETVNWVQDVVHPSDQALVRAHDKLLRGGNESRITYRIQHRDGSVRWLREHATPHHDAVGHITISGILTDVTEQKAAEEVLLQAKQEAETSSRLKTAFIATMSHEIRTPLGAVNGFAQLLRDEIGEYESQATQPLPPQFQEFIGAIHERAEKLLVLVNNLFDLSNVEMGTVSLQRVPVPLHEAIEQLAGRYHATLQEKRLELHLHLDAPNPVAVGDPHRIQQVLDNLLANAIKFTERGTISIQTRNLQHEVQVEIRDTGVGIAQENFDLIFQPFSQEENWRTRRFEGTGLGLALVKRLLNLLGGRIEVESVKGQGSTFRIFLPAARQTPVRSRRLDTPSPT
jgi:PAS domain S-box-containing protein